MKELKEKHQDYAQIEDNCLLFGPKYMFPSSAFDVIDEQIIFKAAMRTKCSTGHSGMDAELYRRILCSKKFNVAGKELRQEIALLARKLSTTTYHPCLIGSFTACRLTPWDKNPGIRPIGVGEVLRRIIGKTVLGH